MTTLYPVQEYALKECKGRNRFGYFLEPGLGKTLLTLHEFTELWKQEKADIFVLFCPQTLIFNWKEQIKEHGFDFHVIVKPTTLVDVYKAAQLGDKPVMVIYNYESIISKVGQTIQLLVANMRAYAVFDESVQIKNFKALRWKKHIRNWNRFLVYARLLSGRPMVQSPMDLWTQLTILDAQVQPSPYAFRNTFCVMGGFKNKQIIGVQNMERLQELVKSVSVTCTKEEWAKTLPPKLPPVTLDYEMEGLQLKTYKEMFKNMIVELGPDEFIAVDMAAHKWAKLQQIASGYILNETGDPRWFMDFKDTPKLKALEEALESIPGKVLIFAYYRASIEALAKHFNAPFIWGGMKESEIQEAVHRFNKSDNQVFILQETSAKYGLTLLGNEMTPCHNTIYWENSYGLDERIQTEDRNHRWGQKYPVGYKDFAGTPAERRVIRALQRKDNVSKTIMSIIKGGI